MLMLKIYTPRWTQCDDEIPIQYMYNFIYIYSFIPMSGCVGMGPSAMLFLGVRDAVKTALLLLLLSKKQ
jgi:hypothetical protein